METFFSQPAPGGCEKSAAHGGVIDGLVIAEEADPVAVVDVVEAVLYRGDSPHGPPVPESEVELGRGMLVEGISAPVKLFPLLDVQGRYPALFSSVYFWLYADETPDVGGRSDRQYLYIPIHAHPSAFSHSATRERPPSSCTDGLYPMIDRALEIS